ncbi:DUF2892 domain-containing protein [Pendulispora albinea]|uniref:DUF2892 domain-containing protein n=1 Tax=Pendulispora albinea TaxID=2741071 RepID=A0ABZ2LWN9_9BACT
MKSNVGRNDRILRGLAGLAMLTCSVMAPMSLAVRVAAFGAVGAYLLVTAIAGTCLGYRLMGRSTCPAMPNR